MRAVLLFLLAATALPAQFAPAPPPASPLDPLQFLLGTWTAKTSSGGSSRVTSSGEYTFHTDLNGTVIIRTSTADTCIAPQAFSCQHHDMLTIYHEADDPALKAIYFDNEGHVIHYKVSLPDADTVIFASSGPGMQYRLLYHLAGGVMTGKFQYASSGGRSGFRSYLEWSGGHPVSRGAADGPFTSSVEALRDTTRILLVFAPNSSDPPFVEQMNEFKGHEREAMDRNLILVPVLSAWSPLDSRLYGANLPFTIDREQQYLRTRFKVYAGFTVILLGKDGGEKARAHAPMAAKTLFETIDSMPMRRLEMQGRGKQPQGR